MCINELHDYFQTMVYCIVIAMALFCFGGFCLVGCRKLKQYCYGVWRTVPKSSLAVMLIFAGNATIHVQKRPIHVNAAVEQSGDEWVDMNAVPAAEKAAYKFFKVTVEMK